MVAAGDTGRGTVQLNVGGQRFVTTFDTLQRDPSSRLALLCRGVLAAPRSENGDIFIDRDPKHFQLLLSFLRDGWCALFSSSEARAEVLHEAKAYSLTSMLAWIRAQEDRLPGTGSFAAAAALPPSPQQLRTLYHSPPHAPSPLSSPYALPFALRLASAGPQPHPAPCGHPQDAAAPSGRWMAGGGAAPGQLPATAVVAGGSLREAFLSATAPPPPPLAATVPPVPPLAALRYSPGAGLPSQPAAASKWTAKCLTGSDGVRQAVNMLLELAYTVPHPALSVGKVEVNITPGECTHDQLSSLSGGAGLPARTLALVSVRCPTTGWACSFPIQPPSHVATAAAAPGAEAPDAPPSLHVKFGQLPSLVQDHWFVLTGVLKDQFGVLLEEQLAAGGSLARPGPPRAPACGTCRQLTLAVTLSKVF